jgi:hypothetical protein
MRFDGLCAPAFFLILVQSSVGRAFYLSMDISRRRAYLNSTISRSDHRDVNAEAQKRTRRLEREIQSGGRRSVYRS